MSISRLKQDETPIHTLTVPLSFDAETGAQQVFDLGSIRIVFLQVILTAFDPDGEPIGPNDIRVELDVIETSRDGIVYAQLTSDFIINDSPYITDPPVFPSTVIQVAFLTPRYVRFNAAIYGANPPVAPTASVEVYLEYV